MTEQVSPSFFRADDALPLQERRVQGAAALLRTGALICGAAALLALIGALIAAASGGFEALRSVLLFRYTGAGDAAAALAIVLLLLDAALLLALMVGALARERWTLAGLIAVIAANLTALIGLGFTAGALALAVSGLAIPRLWGGDALRANPVTIKELRGRMRGARTFVLLTVYLGLMSGFAVLLYLTFNSFARGSALGTAGSAAAGEIGRVLFMGIVGVEMLLIIFIAPAFTAGAVTGERERQTYDLLQTTLLSSPAFILGKLESALGFIVLLLLAAIPLQSLAFLFGGVSEIEIALAFLILLVTAVALGAVGILFSVLLPRTLTASVRAYSAAAAGMFILPTLIGFALNLARDLVFRGAALTPAVEAALTYAELIATALNPIATALQTQALLVERQIVGIWTLTLASDGSTIPMISPWMLFCVLYLATAAILIALAIQRAGRIEG
jgi:hypothetical protein